MEHVNKSLNEQTVLVVDDDEAFSRVLCRAFGRLGLNAWPASSVEQAISAIEVIKPDFAVLDLHLGKQNGLDVLQFLKERNPSARAVILSGYIDLACAVRATRLGAANCLTKPVEAEELVQTLTSMETPFVPVVTQPEIARLNHIIANWEKNDRNTIKTARALNMQRRTLQRILCRLGVKRECGERTEKSSSLSKLRRIYRVWARYLIDHDEPIVRM